MLKRCVLLCLVLLLAAPVLAQQDSLPSQVNAVLNDLSQRVGRTVTQNDLYEYLWIPEYYTDRSLGCPQRGVFYIADDTPGYQFLLTYEDTTYNYHVTEDSSLVVLCGTSPSSETPPEQINDALNDLSLRLGKTVALSDLSGYHWNEDDYSDSFLNCSLPGKQAEEISTPGYEFLMNYEGTTYDYLVAASGSPTILCNSATSGGPVGNPSGGTYYVEAGDTLDSIALRFDVSPDAIAQLNNITNENLIYVGQALELPAGASSSASVYVVQAGDTLDGIAQRFSISPDALAELNNITNENLIYTGQTLMLPTSTVSS